MMGRVRTTKEMWGLAQRNCYKERVNETPCTVYFRNKRERSREWFLGLKSG